MYIFIVADDHTFTGWFTQKSGGVEVTPYADVMMDKGQSQTLYARWSGHVNTCIIRFRANGGSVSPNSMTLTCGSPYGTLPEPVREGYQFMGWFTDADGGAEIYSERIVPVVDTQTLYARWEQDFTDSFSFNNSRENFSSYRLSPGYLEFLKSGESAACQSYLQDLQDSTWLGSDFGMAAVYCLADAGEIDLNEFQYGAEFLRDLRSPEQSQAIQNLIQFYTLTQASSQVTDYIIKAAYTYNSASKTWKIKDTASRYQSIVSGLTGQTKAAILVFDFGERSRHAVAAKSITEIKDADGKNILEYHISIWDPNYPEQTGTLVISSDYTNAAFTGDTPCQERYQQNLELVYILPFSDISKHYGTKTPQDIIAATGSEINSNSISSNLSVWNTVRILTSTNGNFTLTAQDGRKAIIENGVPRADNDLSLQPFSLIAFSADAATSTDININTSTQDIYRYYVHAMDAQTLRITFHQPTGRDTVNSNTSTEMQFLSENLYVKITAEQLTEVHLSGGGISTVCADAVKQQITMASDMIKTDLNAYDNQVKITSSETTGLSLTLDGGELFLTSRMDDTTAQMIFSNAGITNAGSYTQSVSVPADGTAQVSNPISLKASILEQDTQHTLVQITVAEGFTLPVGTSVLAAKYHKNSGRMLDIAAGTLDSNLCVTFDKNMTGVWKLFFLSDQQAPLCRSIILS